MDDKKIYLQDEELVRKAKAGDKRSFEVLYHRYKRQIYNYALRLIGNSSEAEDVAQETFVRAYLNIKTYRPMGKVTNWFYAIAGNLAKNILRSRDYWKTLPLEKREPLGDDEVELINVLPDTSQRPDEAAGRKEIEEKVQQALNTLPEKFKMAIILCDIEELSYEEAAKVLNCDKMTVGSRLSRARAMLAEVMMGYKKELGD